MHVRAAWAPLGGRRVEVVGTNLVNGGEIMHRRGAAWFGAPGFLSTCHLQGSTKIRGVKRRDHGRRGELTAGYREGQEEKLGALGLMLNVIAFWNATYMQAVVENLQAHGRSVNPAELARVSPLAHRHINFLGRYAFTLPEAVARGELRPLRDPNSE